MVRPHLLGGAPSHNQVFHRYSSDVHYKRLYTCFAVKLLSADPRTPSSSETSLNPPQSSLQHVDHLLEIFQAPDAICCVLVLCRQSKHDRPFGVPGLTITSFHLSQLKRSLRVRWRLLVSRPSLQAESSAAVSLRVMLPRQ